MKIKMRKQASHNSKYESYVITIPKEILRKNPRFKRQKFVEIEVDLLGNIIIKPEQRKFPPKL